MIDYHIHTPLCRHAEGKMEDYLEEATRRGLEEVGFADHFPLKMLGVVPEIPVTMEPEELSYYVEKVKELSYRAPVQVKLGIELDYFPGKTEVTAEVLQGLPFDYIIGSVHYINDWDCTHPLYSEEYHKRSLEEVYRDYFALIENACRSGLFDIIAHVDVVKKFGHRVADDVAHDFYRHIAKVFQETNMCLELNTAGWDNKANELYPALELLRECVKKGVGVTAGSDAHAPNQVGRYFDRLEKILKKEGISHLLKFKDRKKSYYPVCSKGE